MDFSVKHIDDNRVAFKDICDDTYFCHEGDLCIKMCCGNYYNAIYLADCPYKIHVTPETIVAPVKKLEITFK